MWLDFFKTRILFIIYSRSSSLSSVNIGNISIRVIFVKISVLSFHTHCRNVAGVFFNRWLSSFMILCWTYSTRPFQLHIPYSLSFRQNLICLSNWGINCCSEVSASVFFPNKQSTVDNYLTEENPKLFNIFNKSLSYCGSEEACCCFLL